MSPSNARMSRPSRQTYIGCDGGIVDADKPSPEKQFILRLPEETLQQIIEYAAVKENWYEHGDYDYDLDFLSKLSRTCHGLRRHTLPLMHRKLSIDTKVVASYRRPQLRLPLEEPTMSLFQAHCRELRVHIDDRSPPANAPFHLLRDLVCHLHNVRKMTVYGGYEGHPKEVWKLVRLALQNMPHARSLELVGKYCGIYLRDAFRHIQSSSLQILRLDGVSRPNDAREEDYILAEVRSQAATTAEADRIYRRKEPRHSPPSA